MAFCQMCIQEIQTQEFTEEAYQFQIECINELMALIPKNKETPAVKATINRFMAYAALFVSQDKSVAYEYFRAVPEEYLSADDWIEVSHLVWLNQTKNDHPQITINLALECSQHAKQKAPADEGAMRLNDVLSKAYLEKNFFAAEKVSAQETLQIHAKKQTLNRATQQIMVLKKYQSYLLLKDEFEPHTSPGVQSISASIDNSKCIYDAVTKLIHHLDMGNALKDLLTISDIENARKVNAGFDGVINKLMELHFLPAQDLQSSSSSCRA